MPTAVDEDGTTPSGGSLPDEIVREGAWWMPAAPLGNAPHLVHLLRAGALFERGRLVERPEAVTA
ncbi:hypothetical protein GCM10010377_78740 [Streptomyces viridiviolaceus]|uniref:Uncharacterized protein n=1 Tax=Streptomyces viridiviolaceus TaxID=68282 RepID=A0ABW2ECY2_9ACTN|nr:hypothetical protein [Streptomyces viridiviolaceus]GHB76579.1 hypothetical protein GCM10010377_78740 [Streptomyces viridiviolaceus]